MNQYAKQVEQLTRQVIALEKKVEIAEKVLSKVANREFYLDNEIVELADKALQEMGEL